MRAVPEVTALILEYILILFKDLKSVYPEHITSPHECFS